MNNTFYQCSWMKSVEAADRKLYNKQSSGCQASKWNTIDAEQMTNKSVRKHPYSLIYELYRAVNTAMLFIRFFLRRRVVKESNYCHGIDFYVIFIETWPQRLLLFYNGCGGMWQCMTHCSCLYVCVFRSVHLEGWEHDHTVKQDRLPGRILHNKASLSSFPRGPDACTIH